MVVSDTKSELLRTFVFFFFLFFFFCFFFNESESRNWPRSSERFSYIECRMLTLNLNIFFI